MFSLSSRMPTTPVKNRKVSSSRKEAKSPYKLDPKFTAVQYHTLRAKVQSQRDIHQTNMITFHVLVPGETQRKTLKYPRTLSRPAGAHGFLTPMQTHGMDGVPTEWMSEILMGMGHSMLLGVSKCKAQLPESGVIPSHIAVSMASILDERPPTNIVAVHNQLAVGERPCATLYPTHGIILAAHCALFRRQEFPIDGYPHPTLPETMMLPVLSFSLPFPHLFPVMQKFLYTKEPEAIFSKGFLPGSEEELKRLTENLKDCIERKRYSTRLVRTCSVPTLVAHAGSVISLWQNMCYIGILDDEMWVILEACWDVLIVAIALATGGEGQL